MSQACRCKPNTKMRTDRAEPVLQTRKADLFSQDFRVFTRLWLDRGRSISRAGQVQVSKHAQDDAHEP
jgi:hypothetical protein